MKAAVCTVLHRLRRTLTTRLRGVTADEATDGEDASGSPLEEGEAPANPADETAPATRADGAGRTVDGDPSVREVADCSWLPPAANPTAGVRPEEITTQADIVQHVGLTPGEFVLALLEHHDGRVEQQAFTEYTGFSESSLSRLLGDLEAQGLVRRFQVGCRKVVCLPENNPGRDLGHDVEEAAGEPERTPTA